MSSEAKFLLVVVGALLSVIAGSAASLLYQGVL